jgi:O-antigen ligase
MKRLMSILVVLYLFALNASMAGMEIVSWTLFAVVVAFQFQRRDFTIFKANRTLNLWILGMTLAVAMSLLVNPLYRTFVFQIGFMRWSLLLWALVFALQEIWNAQFEQLLITLWMFIVAITGAYAGLQCFFGLDLIRDDAVLSQGGGIFKATGWFSESLTFAYNFGVSLFTVSRPAFTRYKRLALPMVVFGGLGIISCISRGAWLASIITVLLYLAFERRRLVLPAMVFFYALTRLLIWYSVGFGGKIEGMENAHVDHSSSMRLHIWRGYWEMWKDHPWFGVGISQGDKLLPEYYARLGIVEEFVSHAHNNFLQFLGGAGVFGFITYCGLNFIFLHKAWRLRKVTAWGWSIFLAQIFMQLGGLTQMNFINGPVTHLLVFIWAILLVVEARHQQGQPLLV